MFLLLTAFWLCDLYLSLTHETSASITQFSGQLERAHHAVWNTAVLELYSHTRFCLPLHINVRIMFLWPLSPKKFLKYSHALSFYFLMISFRSVCFQGSKRKFVSVQYHLPSPKVNKRTLQRPSKMDLGEFTCIGNSQTSHKQRMSNWKHWEICFSAHCDIIQHLLLLEF